MTKPYIYGFKTLTPEQSQFLNTIGYQVLEHRQLDDSHANKTFKTTQDEIKSAAQWAKKIHASNPSKQIVVVSPKINELHYQFKSIFDQVFHDTLNETGQKSYNISLGLSLDQYPLIQHLLLILKLSSQLQKTALKQLLLTLLLPRLTLPLLKMNNPLERYWSIKSCLYPQQTLSWGGLKRNCLAAPYWNKF